jgi:Ca-activated chloride channel homolog
MHRRSDGFRRLGFAALSLICSSAALAQTEASGPVVFRSDLRLVVLHATVANKSGHLLTNLGQNAFRVFENGTEQPIRAFRREDIPVSMGLIIDNSGSMRDRRSKVEAAALALAKDSNHDDEVFVVNFNDDAFLDNPRGKDFTSDIKEMEEALRRIDSRGGTAMRDAIRMSIDHLRSKGHKDKKVLVVVTDGDDNSSAISLEALVRAAQQSEVLIYGVGLLSTEEHTSAKRAERALRTLAQATGGEAYFPKDLAEVDRIAHQVARDVRNQYTITYSPLNAAMDGTYRQIKLAVSAPGAGKLNIRTRSGYYATPDAPPASSSRRPPAGQ